MKDIYILYACDGWKSLDSFRTEVVTTSIRKLKKEIKNMVQKNDMEVGNDSMYEHLMKASLPSSLFAGELNQILEYGYIEVWKD